MTSTDTVTGARWWRNGDHPGDRVGERVADAPIAPGEPLTGGYVRQEGLVVRFYRHPYVPGDAVHEDCGRTWHDHGWIDEGGDGVTVCPGDIVVTNPDGTHSVLADLSAAQRLLGEGAEMLRAADRTYKVPAHVMAWAERAAATLPAVGVPASDVEGVGD